MGTPDDGEDVSLPCAVCAMPPRISDDQRWVAGFTVALLVGSGEVTIAMCPKHVELVRATLDTLRAAIPGRSEDAGRVTH